MSELAQALVKVVHEVGFADFLLPFLLFFAIIYATLDKTEIFGKDRRDINALIAFVIAFIAAMTSWVVKAVTGFIPWLVFVMVVIIGILMGIALVFGDMEKFRKNWGWFGKLAIVIISLVLIAAAIMSLPFSGGGNISIPLDTEDIALLVILVFALAFFAVITRKPKTGGS